jgi:hypothetical protein
MRLLFLLVTSFLTISFPCLLLSLILGEGGHLWLVHLRGGRPGRHRSDRWHAPVWPVMVSATARLHTWARVGKVTLLSALVAQSPLVWTSRLPGEWLLCLMLGWSILGLNFPNLALFLNLVLVGHCILLRGWAVTVDPFSSFFTMSSRLSWEGCTLLFSFNTYKFFWSFSTSCLSSSFSLATRSSQDSTSTCSMLDWLA